MYTSVCNSSFVNKFVAFRILSTATILSLRYFTD